MLLEERDVISSRCGALVALGKAAEWSLCNLQWNRFALELEDRMSLEECELFPSFLAENPAHPAIRGFLADHEEIRSTIDGLGVAIELQALRSADIETLAAMLTLHAEDESEAGAHSFIHGGRVGGRDGGANDR